MLPSARALLRSGAANQGLVTAVALAAVVAIGALDASTPASLRLGMSYVVPVLVAQAWGVRRAGYAAAVASVVVDGAVSWQLGEHRVSTLATTATFRLAVFLACVELVRALQRDRRRLKQLASVDDLTGVLNRRGFSQLAERELQRSARYGHPVGLLFLDVNDFKAINDRHGHGAGDAVLVAVADFLRRTVRGHDLVARIGGDEFAVLLPETDPHGVAAVAEHVTDRLRTLAPPPPLSASQRLSLSVGLAALDDGPTSLDDLLRIADADMYRHKSARRDGR